MKSIGFRFIFFLMIVLGSTRTYANTISIAGQWKFDLDPDDAGIKSQWFTRHEFSDTITLPGTTDQAGKGPLTSGSEPGSLTRVHRYYGPAWYQTQITVPPSWAGKSVDLFLERVIFQSRVWVDATEVNSADSLDTPHVHHLGELAPGVHTLTLRITNTEVQPVGVDAHNFTEQTQTIWNGAVGRIELQSVNASHLQLVRGFPDAASKSLRAQATILNPVPGAVTFTLCEKGSTKVVSAQRVDVAAGQTTVSTEMTLADAPKLWDEFSPNLYELKAEYQSANFIDDQSVPVGFRTLGRAGQQLTINGRPMFIRGNMDHCVFPLTGAPPTDVESWKKVFAIYKSYGMNQMRCHSWTPPEAAFEAADEMGIYIQAEIFWLQYPLGSGAAVGKIRVPPNAPPNFYDPGKSPDDYIRTEMRRVIDTYGNHPSLVFFVIGNELGRSDWPVSAQWIGEEKAHDPRHLYAASTARQITPTDDFNDTHAVPKVGWVRDRIEAFNDWDYEKLYAQAPVPIIAHELGQWPTYPRWSEIGKFTGVVRARDLEACEASAKKYGVFSQDEDFHRASGALAIRLYKDEMESHLRTPSCSGFSTLCMQDYPGQGEALVGWLDSFFDSKGTVTPERFRRWCNSTVPLVRLPKYVYRSSESVAAIVEMAQYGPADLKSVSANWSLFDDGGHAICTGDLHGVDVVKTGTVTTLGKLDIPLGAFRVSAMGHVRLELSVHGLGTPTASNDWDLWVFPDARTAPEPADVQITDSIETAKAALAKSQKVLLIASKLGGKRNKLLANFKPVYWSEWYFPWSETLGALVQNHHPALRGFPTDDHYDWQWSDLCKSGHGFVIDCLSPDYRPIVQPVPDFHLNHRYATIFELVTKAGGKLMVCGYDLQNNLADRPAAAALRGSLLNYMGSSDFHPAEMLTDDKWAVIFPDKDSPAASQPAKAGE